MLFADFDHFFLFCSTTLDFQKSSDEQEVKKNKAAEDNVKKAKTAEKKTQKKQPAKKTAAAGKKHKKQEEEEGDESGSEYEVEEILKDELRVCHCLILCTCFFVYLFLTPLFLMLYTGQKALFLNEMERIR